MIWDTIEGLLKALLESLKSQQTPIVVAPVTVKEIIKMDKWRYWPKAHRPKDSDGNTIRMKTKGKYPRGLVGAVVHYTAGRSGGLKKAISSILGGIKNGFMFVCIADSGELVQAHPVDEWGYHAGESAGITSKMKKLILGSVSDELIGIEINNAGQVKKQKDGTFITYFGVVLQPSEVRYVTEEKYGCPTGYYHKFTPQQEATLIDFLVDLKKREPEVFDFDNVLAHHEVSGKRGLGYFRKPDCGGALSMNMDDFRSLLKKKYEGK